MKKFFLKIFHYIGSLVVFTFSLSCLIAIQEWMIENWGNAKPFWVTIISVGTLLIGTIWFYFTILKPLFKKK